MKNICLAFLLCSTFYGCSSTLQITSEDDARKHLEEKSGTIVLSDSSAYRAKDIHVSNDSMSFVDERTRTPAAYALRNISLVERNNRAAGLFWGVLLGAGSTYAFTSILMENDRRREEHEPEPSGSAEAMRGLMIAGGTLIGGVLGALAGAEIGQPVSYVFSVPGQGELPRRAAAAGLPSPQAEALVDPLSIKRALKAGIDLGNSLHTDRGSIAEGPGYIVGLHSGYNIARKSDFNIALGMELNYSSINLYSPGLILNDNGRSYTVDKMRHLAFGDLGLLPEVFIPVKGDLVMSMYLGGSFGLGSENWKVNSRQVISPPIYIYQPLGIDAENNFRSVVCGTVGMSLYYKHVMLDLRFRNTKATNGGAYENFYLQIGVTE